MNFLRAGYNITPDALSFIKRHENPSNYARLFIKSINLNGKSSVITRDLLEKIDNALFKSLRNLKRKEKPLIQKQERKEEKIQVPTVTASTTSSANSSFPASYDPQIKSSKPDEEPQIDKQDSQENVEASYDGEGVKADTQENEIIAFEDDESEVSYSEPTSKSTFTPNAKEFDSKIKILDDCNNNLKNEGDISDFMALFDDRFNKLKHILQSKRNVGKIMDISDLDSISKNSQDITIVGMVISKRETRSGNTLVEIDDKTGTINVVISSRNYDAKVMIDILEDEVLLFKGFYKNGLFIANEFQWPDIPRRRNITLAEEDLSAVLISDLHVGSDNHLENLWNKFTNWINGNGTSEKAKKMAGKVKYVVIAGDIIDGVGVYPTQEKHLVITDVYAQLNKAAEMLQEFPDHISFIISPGSHEPVRRALPQPCIPEKYSQSLYDLGAHMVGDPSLVEIHGIRTLIYHGEGIIDLSLDIPTISNNTPELAMEKFLKSRHLAPAFGKKAEIAPDKHDWLVINEVPDIFHTGHVHCNGVKMYKGTWLVNSGCFQGQTDFMKSLGIVPTIGKPNIINLHDFKLTTLNLTN